MSRRKAGNAWQRTFCIMARRVTVWCKLKPFMKVHGDGEAKASPKWASIVPYSRPETEWSTHGQSEPRRKSGGGSNPSALKNRGMSYGSERKTKQTQKLLVLLEIVLGLALCHYIVGVECWMD